MIVSAHSQGARVTTSKYCNLQSPAISIQLCRSSSETTKNIQSRWTIISCLNIPTASVPTISLRRISLLDQQDKLRRQLAAAEQVEWHYLALASKYHFPSSQIVALATTRYICGKIHLQLSNWPLTTAPKSQCFCSIKQTTINYQ